MSDPSSFQMIIYLTPANLLNDLVTVVFTPEPIHKLLLRTSRTGGVEPSHTLFLPKAPKVVLIVFPTDTILSTVSPRTHAELTSSAEGALSTFQLCCLTEWLLDNS